MCSSTSNPLKYAHRSVIGIMAAIISIVHTLTAILAVVTIIAHCVAIFWPRKAMTTVVDTEGRPILWRNQEGAKKDVACVWWDEPQDELAAELAAHAKVVSNVTSFSSTVQPLSMD